MTLFRLIIIIIIIWSVSVLSFKYPDIIHIVGCLTNPLSLKQSNLDFYCNLFFIQPPAPNLVLRLLPNSSSKLSFNWFKGKCKYWYKQQVQELYLNQQANGTSLATEMVI